MPTFHRIENRLFVVEYVKKSANLAVRIQRMSIEIEVIQVVGIVGNVHLKWKQH